MSRRVAVIGGGLAGLTAALAAARAGANVTLIVGGQGVHHLFSGCLDVLAYPAGATEPVEKPLAAVAKLAAENPRHPYALVGADRLRRALAFFRQELAAAGVELLGDGETQRRVVTAFGTLRPTALVPATMAAAPERIAAVCNLSGFGNFSAALTAGELGRRLGRTVAALDFAGPAARRDAIGLSRALARPDYAAALGDFLRVQAPGQTVLIPAVLGPDNTLAVKRGIEERFGGELCEAPGQPPSLPGLRLFTALRRRVLDAGVRVAQAARVVGPVVENGRLTGLRVKTGPFEQIETADAFVLATGHLVSGGLIGDRDGLREPVFALPVVGASGRPYFDAAFLSPDGHPALATGVATDDRLRPLSGELPLFDNLFAGGDILAGFDPYRERSGGGVAVATGDLAGRYAAGDAS